MKYKNISDKELALIGVGIIKPDEVFKTDKDINNPNFIKVDERKVETEEGKIKIKKAK